ncbi:MAG: metallophosphoesterase [Chloroflexi bacterium]|nr:metallophosphoesterase [Chloroflexota bacterium]
MAATLGSTAVGTGSLAVYSRTFEPGWLSVTPIAVPMPHLAPAFDGYRIAQISDLHADDWMTGDRLAAIVDAVNRQQPDLVAITGDFFTDDPRRFGGDFITALSRLAPRDATPGVLGNHDYWTDATVVRQILRRSSILDVGEAVHTLRRDGAPLSIAGISSIWQQRSEGGDVWSRRDRLAPVLTRLSERGAAVLLAHEPDFADVSTATGRFDLQLSGHSHGGQVIPLFQRPPVLPPYARKYPIGRYQVGRMVLYTNRGVGMVRPRLRLNCRPEITVLTLHSGET